MVEKLAIFTLIQQVIKLRNSHRKSNRIPVNTCPQKFSLDVISPGFPEPGLIIDLDNKGLVQACKMAIKSRIKTNNQVHKCILLPPRVKDTSVASWKIYDYCIYLFVDKKYIF